MKRTRRVLLSPFLPLGCLSVFVLPAIIAGLFEIGGGKSEGLAYRWGIAWGFSAVVAVPACLLVLALHALHFMLNFVRILGETGEEPPESKRIRPLGLSEGTGGSGKRAEKPE